MTDTSSISIRDNPLKHRFEAESQGKLAFAIYSLTDDVITFIHTIVPESLRGHGIATRLVLAGLASARERGLRVIPKCPVFAAYMREHPKTHDLLADEGRTLLGI
jgi:hypothetical protein